ncbi:MAG: winged helix DNA-binding domain-containing protein, partial [Candidatus Wallbacteria bacterium]|nr:winged helix DNA-binding domain-containing protein [Candidatus Wallbacteria bacterium]
MTLHLSPLRAHAVTQTLFAPTSLERAMDRLGFVQADPIRSPATAQDLILRHRVTDYRAGDLERRYPAMELEEDYLYAYGFVPRRIGRLLHPRRGRELSALERQVLETVRSSGQIHPRQLEVRFGRGRVVNAWGGHSKATTRALDLL